MLFACLHERELSTSIKATNAKKEGKQHTTVAPQEHTHSHTDRHTHTYNLTSLSHSLTGNCVTPLGAAQVQEKGI